MKSCKECGHQVSENALFCSGCGVRQDALEEPQKRICSNPDCGNELASDTVFCGKCGKKT